MQEKTCYQTIPIVTLSKIEKSKYIDNTTFPLQEFDAAITKLKVSLKEYIGGFKTGHHKLDLLIRFDKRVNEISELELPVMRMVSRVELRKDHFVNTIFDDLKIVTYKDDI